MPLIIVENAPDTIPPRNWLENQTPALIPVNFWCILDHYL